jgi:RNA polymerase sigma factor (sigma-70 family)
MFSKTSEQNCSDAVIISGLKAGPGAAFNHAFACLYQHCKPELTGWIIQRGGNEADADDVFQDALVGFMLNVSQGKSITTTACGYLFGIARNIWYKKLRKRGREDVLRNALQWDGTEHQDAIPVEEESRNLQDEIVQNCWAKLTERCQAILTDYFQGEPFENIANKYGYKSAHTARMTKLRCLQSLRDCVRPQLNVDELIF